MKTTNINLSAHRAEFRFFLHALMAIGVVTTFVLLLHLT